MSEEQQKELGVGMIDTRREETDRAFAEIVENERSERFARQGQENKPIFSKC